VCVCVCVWRGGVCVCVCSGGLCVAEGCGGGLRFGDCVCL